MVRTANDIWRGTALAVAALCALAHSASGAVFGPDDRVDVPANLQQEKDALGVLFNIRSRSVCTAFCLAPDMIATAAHCLFRTRGEATPRLADFWFARGYDQVREYARITGHLTGSTAQNVIAGSQSLRVAPPIDATSDWAFVRLARPVCGRHSLKVQALTPEAILAASELGKLFQIAYHRDFVTWKPAWSGACAAGRSYGDLDWATISADFTNPSPLLLHTCDTGGASSGSPLFVTTPDGPRVVAINVGTYVHSRVIMRDGRVTERSKPETVANTAVASIAFTERLAAFRGAAIVQDAAGIREMQDRLRQRRLYTGPLNGIYAAALRDAIEAFEASLRLPVTGLATQATLQRLRE